MEALRRAFRFCVDALENPAVPWSHVIVAFAAVAGLRNLAEVVAYGEGDVVDVPEVAEVLGDQQGGVADTGFITLPDGGSLKEMEGEIVRQLLARYPAEEVCRRLGVSRVTLWRRMKDATGRAMARDAAS